MTEVFTKMDIVHALQGVPLMAALERGFVLLSEGKVSVPRPTELLLPDGEVHIKYGYVQGGAYYLVKIASGFPKNEELGLGATPGCMLLASQETGHIDAVLMEQGYLTNLRTAVAGAIAAKYLAPTSITQIGVFGTGTQARLQLLQLKEVTPCRKVIVWGRRESALEAYAGEMSQHGFTIHTTRDAETAAGSSNLLVLTTAASSPYLRPEALLPGTHITAVGADSATKAEMTSEVFRRADIVVADSIVQCTAFGELRHGIAAACVRVDQVVELGDVIVDPRRGRADDRQITIADLTGVAVQDLMIAELALQRLHGRSRTAPISGQYAGRAGR